MSERPIPLPVNPLASKLVSLTDAERYSGISRRTLRRKIAQGLLPGYQAGTRMTRVSLTDVDALFSRIPTLQVSGGVPDDAA